MDKWGLGAEEKEDLGVGEESQVLRQRWFSSGLELANLVASSEILDSSWDAIADLYSRNTSAGEPTRHPLSLAYHVYQRPSAATIIAFVTSASANVEHLRREGIDLVSSDELAASLPLFDFIPTKVNPSFSVHKAAATLFASHQDALSLLKDKHGNSSPLIITGHSMGGSIASLFTLWVLDSISPKATKRPFCVTFGSPLVGNNYFQKAISERPSWNSCFLHVVSYQDPVPKFSVSSYGYSTDGSTTQTCYMPFGTFLFCSDSGGSACFEEPESVLELMMEMSSELEENQNQNKNLQIIDYGLILQHLKCTAKHKENSSLDQSLASSLEAGIIIQLEAIGIKRLQHKLQPQQNNTTLSLIANVAKRMEDVLIRKRNVFDPAKKLNDIKIEMTYMEWYKKVTLDEGGYYDSYKFWRSKSRDAIKSRQEIVMRKRILTRYWRRMVDEAEQMPQKEGVAFRTRWLYAGTNYRRMIEPLDIAEYYSDGKTDYTTQGRCKHYKLLEQWMNEEKQCRNGNANSRNKACSLTEDSCFWAHVEEAMICCRVLKNDLSSPESRESPRSRLFEFEQYVMDLIKDYSVSFEVFLEQSSFMQWWREYSEIIGGSSYHSPLTDFMKNGCYKEYA
ncbi:hypothetical protein ACH5RR_011110 [Cinchona calisaya]|uniref:Uncharacterized protein n=1 Tax=Cinchona calisaya TaxID=153742 RepID=A0ABD3A3Y5_9GENT